MNIAISQDQVNDIIIQILGQNPTYCQLHRLLVTFIETKIHSDVFIFLVKNKIIDLRIDGIRYLEASVDSDNYCIINFLLHSRIINANIDRRGRLLKTLKIRYPELLLDSGISVEVTYNDFTDNDFEFIVTNNKLESLKLMVSLGHKLSSLGTIAIKAVSVYGYLDMAEFILSNGNVDASDRNNYAIIHASGYGYTKIVDLLLKYSNANPADQNNYAICVASENGHYDVVKLLIRDRRVLPNDFRNYCIRAASKNGHYDIVNLLIRDKRVSPNALDNYCIRAASRNGHYQIVNLLLCHPLVDPSVDGNYAIKVAAKYGHHMVIEHLINHRNVDPCVENNYVLNCAIFNGDLRLVEILLQYEEKIDPSAYDNYAITLACEKGHKEIVIALLKNTRVKPSVNNNWAIKIALFNNHIEIVKFLLKNCKVRLSQRDRHTIVNSMLDGVDPYNKIFVSNLFIKQTQTEFNPNIYLDPDRVFIKHTRTEPNPNIYSDPDTHGKMHSEVIEIKKLMIENNLKRVCVKGKTFEFCGNNASDNFNKIDIISKIAELMRHQKINIVELNDDNKIDADMDLD